MSKSDDEEERENFQKRQRRPEDTSMRSNIDPQYIVKLLRK
jgi:hypothetical protein